MNEQKKTVRDWLNELPEPIRTRAVRNENGEYTNRIVYSLKEALQIAFYWIETEEGESYWLMGSYGNYSEACALLGETLQTEHTEPEQEELITDSLLESVKHKIAQEEYSQYRWWDLTESQKAHEVDRVAIRYAELVNNQKQ